MQGKTAAARAALIAIACMGTFLAHGCGSARQSVRLRAVTEHALGDKNARTDTAEFVTGEYTPGTECRVLVTFDIVDKAGPGLFTGQGEGEAAYIRCSRMEAEKRFTAKGGPVNIQLSLSALAGDIVSESGERFDPDTQKLRPYFEVGED